jgi:hypothetical protein
MAFGNATAALGAPDTEYTIYTFQHDPEQDNNPTHWQKHETLPEMDKALTVARSLFDSGRYCRIEVKRRSFDHRARRSTHTTLKTYGKRRRLKLGLFDVAALAMLCGAAAFIMLWILGERI